MVTSMWGLRGMFSKIRQGWAWTLRTVSSIEPSGGRDDAGYNSGIEEEIQRLNAVLARAERYKPGNARNALPR